MADKLSELRAACIVKQALVRPWLQKFSFLLTDDTLEAYELESETEDQTLDLITMRENFYAFKKSVREFDRSANELETAVGWQ